MINIVDTTDTIDLITSSAAQLYVRVDGVTASKTTGAFVAPYRQNTPIASATTTTIASAVASGNFATLKNVTVRNADASLSCDVTPRHNISGTAAEMPKTTLAPGQCLEYIEGLGWFVFAPIAARGGLKNVSTADQSIGASVTNYITGSAILLPNPVVAGMVLRWTIHTAKSAASVAQGILAVRFGTGGSTSDTARCSATLDVETAAADEAVDTILATIRGPIGASCVVQSTFMRNDNLSTTGFSNTARKAQVQAIQSATFDITPAGTIAGLSYQTGASHALTIRQVHAELLTVGG